MAFLAKFFGEVGKGGLAKGDRPFCSTGEMMTVTGPRPRVRMAD